MLPYELLLLATKHQPCTGPESSQPETAAAAKAWLDSHFTDARLNVAALAARLPVADVAVRCGLPDLAHFSKLISRHTGYSPRNYRQRHALASNT